MQPALGLAHARLSPKLLLELRGGYNRFDEDFFPEDHDFDPNSIGLATVSRPAGLRAAADPRVGLRERRRQPVAAARPRRQQLAGLRELSYNAGRHNWKAGYEFRRTTVDGFFDAGYRGRARLRQPRGFRGRPVAGGRQADGDSQRFTFQNNHGFYLQDASRSRAHVTLNCGRPLGLLRRHRRDGDRLQRLRHRERPAGDAGDAAVRQGLEQLRAARQRRLRHLTGDGTHASCAPARDSTTTPSRRTSSSASCRGTRSIPVRPTTTCLDFSFSPASEIVAGRAGLRRVELQRLRRLHGRSERCARRTSRSTTSTTSTSSARAPRCRSATSARWAAISSAIATSTSSIRRPARAPFPGLHLHQPVRVDGDARATTRCRRACGCAQWKGLTSTRQLHAGALDGHRERRPGLRAATPSQPDDSTQPGRERAPLELRRAPPAHVVLHLGHHGRVERRTC